MDLAAAMNQEMKDLVSRGVDLIQIAEPLGFYESESWMVEAINTAFEGVDAYRVVHICYVLNEGQSGIGESQAERLVPVIADLDCEQVHFQQAVRDFAEVTGLKNWPNDKDLGVGVLEVQRTPAESPQQIADWIRRTTEVVSPERVCLSSDCGMGSFRSRVIAGKKLEAMVAGAKLARAHVTGEPLEGEEMLVGRPSPRHARSEVPAGGTKLSETSRRTARIASARLKEHGPAPGQTRPEAIS